MIRKSEISLPMPWSVVIGIEEAWEGCTLRFAITCNRVLYFGLFDLLHYVSGQWLELRRIKWNKWINYYVIWNFEHSQFLLTFELFIICAAFWYCLRLVYYLILFSVKELSSLGCSVQLAYEAQYITWAFSFECSFFFLSHFLNKHVTILYY